MLEYEALAKLHGREGQDWRVRDRIRSQTSSGRQIEQFILETSGGRKVVYFDITDVLRTEDSAEVREVVDRTMRRQQQRALTIQLPEGPFVMLYKTMDDVGAQVASADFDAAAVLDKVLDASADRSLDGSVSVTLSVAEWIRILGVTNVLELPNLQTEELVNDLRAYIEGALKRAGAG